MKIFSELMGLEPEVREGEAVMCPRCLGRHRLVDNELLLYYECEGELRLGAVAGKLVMGEV